LRAICFSFVSELLASLFACDTSIVGFYHIIDYVLSATCSSRKAFNPVLLFQKIIFVSPRSWESLWTLCTSYIWRSIMHLGVQVITFVIILYETFVHIELLASLSSWLLLKAVMNYVINTSCY